MDQEEATEYAISCGLKVFKDFIRIHNKSYNPNQALLSATRWGHPDLIKYIVEQNELSDDSFVALM